jgi:hypothetical protein
MRYRAIAEAEMAKKTIQYTEQAALTHDKALYTERAGPDAPQELLTWLTRLRLLNGVPFAYLVAHEKLLPLESMRFFYVDRNWTDAAVDGALSAGTITSRDRAQLHSIYKELRRRLDDTERQSFQNLIGVLPKLPATSGDTEVTTGFLLRSRAVSGWPGLHVNAYTGRDRETSIGIIRIERLAPAVLLVLFDGIPGFMTLTEPRQGIQFGVDVDPTDVAKRRIRIRNDDGTEMKDGARKPIRELVPFRDRSPGVIHWVELADRVRGHVGGTVSSAEMGLQMLRFPFEQEFGEPEDDAGSTFVATYALELLQQTYNLENF